MKKKIAGWMWIIFWGILTIILISNFVHEGIGLSYVAWHLFLHAGIIIFSFFALIFSLRLNEKARNFVLLGLLLCIILNSFLFLSYLFIEYNFLQTNIFVFFGIVAGIFMIMKGFKEAVNG